MTTTTMLIKCQRCYRPVRWLYLDREADRWVCGVCKREADDAQRDAMDAALEADADTPADFWQGREL